MEKVKCINDTFSSVVLGFYQKHGVITPKKDTWYHIRQVENVRGKVGVFLEEIVNPKVPVKSILSGSFMKEPSWDINRFVNLLNQPILVEELEDVHVY